jgi:hypothetical protein
LNVDRRIGSVLVSLAVLACAGCGKSKNPQGRLPFSGTVTLDGQPLTGGHLNFEPQGGQATQSGGMIKDGKFDVTEEAGAAPGLYSVAIFSGAAPLPAGVIPGSPEADVAALQGPGELVPPKYNVRTTLTADVKPGEENVFSFELSTK